jgi:hypothetical protein
MMKAKAASDEDVGVLKKRRRREGLVARHEERLETVKAGASS